MLLQGNICGGGLSLLTTPTRVVFYILQNKYFLSGFCFLLMTKYFVMREYESILAGYLFVVTTVFSQQDGISIF
jgi:hypothetical protein